VRPDTNDARQDTIGAQNATSNPPSSDSTPVHPSPPPP
jgi:hypothetical protein